MWRTPIDSNILKQINNAIYHGGWFRHYILLPFFKNTEDSDYSFNQKMKHTGIGTGAD